MNKKIKLRKHNSGYGALSKIMFEIVHEAFSKKIWKSNPFAIAWKKKNATLLLRNSITNNIIEN